MDDMAVKRLQDIYGLNPDIPHMALQFPRLPPRLSRSMFQIYEEPIKERFLRQASSTANQGLKGFQHMYQQYAAGLLTMDFTIIPPGHPLYTRQNSVETLQTENSRLLKENLELRKKLEKKPEQSPDQASTF